MFTFSPCIIRSADTSSVPLDTSNKRFVLDYQGYIDQNLTCKWLFAITFGPLRYRYGPRLKTSK